MSSSIVPSALTPTLILNYYSASIPKLRRDLQKLEPVVIWLIYGFCLSKLKFTIDDHTVLTRNQIRNALRKGVVILLVTAEASSVELVPV